MYSVIYISHYINKQKNMMRLIWCRILQHSLSRITCVVIFIIIKSLLTLLCSGRPFAGSNPAANKRPMTWRSLLSLL